MNEHDDMTTPVTRGELRQELRETLEIWTGAIFARMDAMGADLRQSITAMGAEFRRSMAAMEGRFDESMAAMEGRFDESVTALEDRFQQSIHAVERSMTGMEGRLTVELQRHTSASAEDLRGSFGAVDDKYRDRPDRVTKLETAVFTPTSPPRRARKRKAG